MTYWRDVLSADAMRAHARWLYRKREGEGRLVLRDERLGEARQSGATFDYASLEGCVFDGAEIVYSRFDHAELTKCIITKAILFGSPFRSARLNGCQFDGSDLRACWFTEASIADCSFLVVDLDRANFVRAQVDRSSFNGARLTATQIDFARFSHCDFRRAHLHDTVFGTVFEDCDFRGADLDRLRLKDTRFVRCRFARVIGTPIIEGAYEIVDPSFEDDAPFEGPHSADELRRAWGEKSAQP